MCYTSENIYYVTTIEYTLLESGRNIENLSVSLQAMDS